MDVETGNLLVRILFAIFRDRPSCGFSASVSILVIFFGVLLFRAQNPDELFFPVFGLAIVFAVILFRLIVHIRQQSIQDLQALEPTPFELEEHALEIETAPFELDEDVQEIEAAPLEPERDVLLVKPTSLILEFPSPQARARLSETLPPRIDLPKTHRKISAPLLGGLVAGGTVLPVLCIASLALPAFANEDIWAIIVFVGVMSFFTSLPAIFFGSLASAKAIQIARRRNLEAHLGGLVILAGVAVGLLLGVIAALILLSWS